MVDFKDRQEWVEVLKNTWIGDANLDLEFNSSDMVQVFAAGTYERPGRNATWEEGDWNCNLLFDSSDMVAAFAGGGYEKCPKGQLAVAATAVVVTAVVIRPMPALRTAEAQAFFNEAEAYRLHQDYANAAHWYERALDEFPAYCDAAYNLARIYTDISPDVERVIAILEPVAGPCAADIELRQLGVPADDDSAEFGFNMLGFTAGVAYRF